jgi:hypothetical protein
MHRRNGWALLLGLAFVLAAAAPARADIDLKFGGIIQSDIRYRLAGEFVNSPYPSQYKLLKYGFSRNENLIKSTLALTISNKVKAVADVDLYLYGYSDANDIDALTLRERVDPYRLEVNAAYIDVYKLLPGLDVRIGRQAVIWGVADKFNPTNNVNTLDLSDPLLFGKALANNMIRLDYNPKGDWIITGVVVPIFRPAELPRTAPVALQDVDRPAPVQEEEIRTLLHNDLMLMRPQSINVVTLQPDPSINNVQYALRVAGRILGQDVSLSYYHGRFGIPVPSLILFHDNVADVGVVWPRQDVIGGDIAGSIEKLGGVGYWIEAAVTIPDTTTFSLYQDVKSPRGVTRYEERFTIMNDTMNGGTYASQTGYQVDTTGVFTKGAAGQRATVIPGTPFFKLTVGADYSIGPHVYVNVQYVHGFIDEFGAGTVARPTLGPDDKPRVEQRIGDYIVAGCDAKLLSDTLLLRFFGVVKVPSINWDTKSFDDYKFTAVLFPQIAWAVWDATELSIGAFVFLGDRTTKFGDPAAGASELFAKAKFTY